MAHKGRFYPVWNPSRLFTGGGQWPLFWPTEFKWQVDSWGGPRAVGAPLSGRSMLPRPYVVGMTELIYEVTLNGILGPAFTAQVKLIIEPNPWQWTTIFQVFTGGLPQLGEVPFVGTSTNTQWDQFTYSRIGGYTIPPGSLAYPGNYFQGKAYRWTDPAPPPPASAPF